MIWKRGGGSGGNYRRPSRLSRPSPTDAQEEGFSEPAAASVGDGRVQVDRERGSRSPRGWRRERERDHEVSAVDGRAHCYLPKIETNGHSC